MRKGMLAAAAALAVLFGSAATHRAEALPISATLGDSIEGSTGLENVQYRRYRRAYYPRYRYPYRGYYPRYRAYRYVAPRRYYGPGSGTGLGRVYTGPGSGTGLGRVYTGPGSGTGLGRF